MGFHQSPRRVRLGSWDAHDLRVNKVQRTDIQCRRYCNFCVIGGEVFDEVEADLAVIDATVDVGTGDIEKPRSTDRLAKCAQDFHGRRSAFAQLTREEELRQLPTTEKVARFMELTHGNGSGMVLGLDKD